MAAALCLMEWVLRFALKPAAPELGLLAVSSRRLWLFALVRNTELFSEKYPQQLQDLLPEMPHLIRLR